MTLSAKQLKKIGSLDSMINHNHARLVAGPRRFRPDQNVFAKLAKWVEVWAQNTSDRLALDSATELQDTLYKVTLIAVSPFDLSALYRVTTQYALEQCQFMLVKGSIENNINWKTTFKTQPLLPTVNSYVQLIS